MFTGPAEYQEMRLSCLPTLSLTHSLWQKLGRLAGYELIGGKAIVGAAAWPVLLSPAPGTDSEVDKGQQPR